jgi:hypothetical protein
MERLGHGWVQGTYAPLPTSAGYLKRRRAYVGSSDHDPWSTRALMTIDRHLPDTLTVRLDYTTKPPKVYSKSLEDGGGAPNRMGGEDQSQRYSPQPISGFRLH